MAEGSSESAIGAASAAPAQPLAELLARGDPAGPALIVPDSGEVLTYGQTAARIETLAQRLAGLGVRRGDRVALALPNGPDFVLLLLAIAVLGAAAAPLNPGYTETEFGFFLTDIAPRLMLIPASGATAAAAAASAAGTTLLGVQAGDDGPPALLTDEGPAAPLRSFEPGGPDDVAVVLHTSGTTSRPKQVPLRQRNLMAATGTDCRALPAWLRGRVVLRHAAVPHSWPGGIGVLGTAGRRLGHRAAPVHPAPLLATGPRTRRHLAVGRPDAASDDP